MSPEDAAELLTGWSYFKTDASDAEIENLLNKYDPLPAGDDAMNEGKVTRRVLLHAAKLEPNEAAVILHSWRYHQSIHSEAELDEMYATYRAERREQGRLELERLFKLGEGEGDDK